MYWQTHVRVTNVYFLVRCFPLKINERMTVVIETYTKLWHFRLAYTNVAVSVYDGTRPLHGRVSFFFLLPSSVFYSRPWHGRDTNQSQMYSILFFISVFLLQILHIVVITCYSLATGSVLHCLTGFLIFSLWRVNTVYFSCTIMATDISFKLFAANNFLAKQNETGLLRGALGG